MRHAVMPCRQQGNQMRQPSPPPACSILLFFLNKCEDDPAGSDCMAVTVASPLLLTL